MVAEAVGGPFCGRRLGGAEELELRHFFIHLERDGMRRETELLHRYVFDGATYRHAGVRLRTEVS